MTIYSYTVARDFGFAPNPFMGFCTLACCKPGIRKGAMIGDWIIGVGGVKGGLPGRVIYAMIVEEKLSFKNYWDDPRFQTRKPVIGGTHKKFFGDNIYEWNQEQSRYVQSNSHHSYSDGTTNIGNLIRDTSADYVLISRNYVYFGENAKMPPDYVAKYNGQLFPRRVRNYYKSYSSEFEEQIKEWLLGFEWGFQGNPSEWRNAFERSKRSKCS